MRSRKPYLFLAAYFLVLFLWLWFCYRQVQKACIEAGHTSQKGTLEVIPWPEEMKFFDRAKKGEAFFGSGKEEEVEAKKTEKKAEIPENRANEPVEQPAEKETPSLKEAEKQDAEKAEFAEAKEKEDSETIRVLLLSESGIYHDRICLEVSGEALEITAKSPYFKGTNIIRIRFTGKGEEEIFVTSLERACGHPSYRGTLEIWREDERLVLINEVSLEEYVKGVLPSEMPSSYPLEALKAQAVCARTYAKMKQANKVYPQYDAAVDDSTACQVYRNIETTLQGDLAVEETAGEALIKEDGSYAECYYYSTSCGRGTTMAVWHGGETKRPILSKSKEEITLMNQEFFDYISQKQEGHLEAEEAFYRWNYECKEADAQEIFRRCRDRQAVNDKLIFAENKKDGSALEITKEKLGNITDMSIVERQEGGVADCLKISCKNGVLYVWGEYNIRHVLSQGGVVKLQNETDFQVSDLLPSAFLSLQSICNKKGNMVGYIVVGGGFGHGVGLSQNGAKHMAAAGNSYSEILGTYYEKCSIFHNQVLQGEQH